MARLGILCVAVVCGVLCGDDDQIHLSWGLSGHWAKLNYDLQ